MFFKQIFDPKLAQYSYLVGCQATGEAIVIDPMRDIDQYDRMAQAEGLRITAAADTHIHADYISGLREFAEQKVKVYASDEGDKDWKYEWLINSNGYDYQLLRDGDTFSIGRIEIRAIHTPGHTPEHLIYAVTDRGGGATEPLGAVTGDFIFVGDLGRPDLLESAAGQAGIMEPSARKLYSTVKSSADLADHLLIWPGHGAGSACGKSLGAVPQTSMGYERKFNPALKAATSEDEFVKFILAGQPEPPMYFARMKRDNKQGPAVLKGEYPRPENTTPETLAPKAVQKGVAVVDARTRDKYAEAHLPGSLLSPLNKAFNTIIGSFVDEDEDIYLIIEDSKLDEAIRDLIRIGLDRIKGYITPEQFDEYRRNGGKVESMPVKTFSEAKAELAASNVAVLDVRKYADYEPEHIPGAVNAADSRLPEYLDNIPKDKTLYVHCTAGSRSAVSAAYLKRAGYDTVLIDDNFDNWKQLGGEVVSD